MLHKSLINKITNKNKQNKEIREILVIFKKYTQYMHAVLQNEISILTFILLSVFLLSIYLCSSKEFAIFTTEVFHLLYLPF